MVLKKAATPGEIVRLGVDGIVSLWKEAKLRAAGSLRIKSNRYGYYRERPPKGAVMRGMFGSVM